MLKAPNGLYNCDYYSNCNEKSSNDNYEEEEENAFIANSYEKVKVEQMQILSEEIVIISTSMPLMRTIAFLSSLVFLLLLFIRFFFNVAGLSYIFISIPLSITIISLVLYMNISLMLQSMKIKQKQSRFSSIIAYMCLNSAGISLLFFVCLLSLRLDLYVMNDSLTITKPLILCITIYLFYSLIIQPMSSGNDNNPIDWFDTGIKAINAITLLVTIYLIIKNKGGFTTILSPCYFSLIINWITLFLYQGIKDTSNNMKLIGICFIGLGMVVLNMKLEFILDNNNHWVEIGIGIVGYLMICFEFAFGTLIDDILLLKKSAETKLN